MFLKKYKRFRKYSKKNIKRFWNLFDFFLVSESNFFFSEIQFNCIKKIILKFLKPFKSSYFFNVKPYFFLTSKPSESRMGGGKGNLSFKVFNIKEGQIFLSFRGVPSLFLFNLVSKLSYKLPNKFKLVKSKF